MRRLTLNTGSESTAPRETVDTASIDQVRPLVRAGGGAVPYTEFEVVVSRQGHGGAVFRISHASRLVTVCGVAWTDEGSRKLWAALEEEYFVVTQKFPYVAIFSSPQQPDPIPWLGVILLPAMWTLSPEDVCWLGDLENCLAWALVETAGDVVRTSCWAESPRASGNHAASRHIS